MATEFRVSDLMYNLKRILSTKENAKTFLAISLLSLYQLLMAVTVMTVAPDNASMYHSIFLLSLVLALLPVVLARAIRSNIIPAVVCGFLIESGLAFQASISADYSVSRPAIFLSLVSIMLTVFFQQKLYPRLKANSKILFSVYVGSCILLAISGLVMRLSFDSSNGAYCWVYIGGTSIQVSEVLKLLYLLTLFFGTQISKSDKDLFFKTLFPTVSFSLGLIIINEGGTLVLCAATWLIALFFLTENAKQLTKEFGFILGGGSVILGILAVFRKILYGKSGLAGTLYDFSDKVFSRIFAVLRPESADTDSYQIDRALKAFGQARFFGTDSAYLQSVPEYTNDMVLASVAARFGSIIACFIIASFLIFFIISIRKFGKDDKGALLIITSSNIFLQAMIVILGNLNITPVVGLTLPFISTGFSSFIVSCSIFTFALISMSESNALTKREE